LKIRRRHKPFDVTGDEAGVGRFGLGEPRNDERHPGLVDKDRIRFVDQSEMKRPEDGVLGPARQLVAR
jgi:hypothetical protein